MCAAPREAASVPIVYPAKGRTRLANITVQRGIPHRKLLPVPSGCLDDGSFCDFVPGYPEEMVNQLMRTWGSVFRSYFQSGEEEEAEVREKKKSELKSKEDDQQVRTPFGGAPEAQVCDVHVEVRYPRIGLDKDGLMRIIVNTGTEFRQPVLIEKCRNEDGTCGRIHDMLPAGHTTRCATKYVNRVLIALPLDDNQVAPVPTKFSFPAACVCFVRTYYYPGKD